MSKILHISEALTIAFHSIGLIARSKKIITAQKISDITNYSKNHISKILQQLVRKGYLISTRGPRGGFMLHEKAKNINLMHIYTLIEGDIEESTCKMNCNNCPFNQCIFGGLAEKFSKEFRDYLKHKKVTEI
ncbi:MAG: RrF2 family transcriptional regulator [Bacteroidota bacterium]